MEPQGIERKLATILAADVVEYSRHIDADEAGTLAALKRHRAELIDPKIAEHHGRIFKLMGDGALVEFASVVDAVACAVEIQRGMAERNAETPEDKRIRFRIGINLGDVIFEDDDIYGGGVIVASRLEGLAEPEGVCISGTAFDQVRNKLDVGFEYRGEQEVKNIAEPVRVYRVLMEPEAAGKVLGHDRVARGLGRRPALAAAVLAVLVAAAGAAIWLQRWAPDVERASVERMAYPLPDKPSIAVLPFDNLSGDPGQDPIADGFTESLITTLAQMPFLFVIARNSTFTYKGAAVAVKQVAEELGVRYVLEGSFQREGDTLRIAAQLIDALEGHHLWAGKFDRDVNAMFAVQDEIIREIFTALQVELVAGEHGRVWQKGTDNFEAYLVWLEGWKHFRRYTKGDNAIARQLIQQAIDMDPDWAMPYTTLAWTYMRRFDESDSPAESVKLAAEAAQKALALDDTYPGVYAALGGVHGAKGEIEQAITYHEKAVALGPNISIYHAILAYNLTDAGRAAEAIPLLKKAMRLSPTYHPWFLSSLGAAYNAVSRYEDAAEAYKQFLHRRPESTEGHAGLIVSNMWLGREQEAQSYAAELLRIKPKFSLDSFKKLLKYKDQAYMERFLDALRKAGLPE